MLFLLKTNQDTNQILNPVYYACITQKKFACSFVQARLRIILQPVLLALLQIKLSRQDYILTIRFNWCGEIMQ